MDLGIKELGITFMVGAFTILGLELILYYFFDIQLTGFFQGRLGLDNEPVNEENKQNARGKGTVRESKVEAKEQTMRTAVFIGLAFAIGILAEDLSYKYVDNIETPFKTLPAYILPDELVNTLDLPSRYDSRVKTLINDLKEKPSPQWLAYDLARNGAFTMADPNNGAKVEQWIKDPNRCKPSETSTSICPSSDEIRDSILILYYYAKNNVYEHPNYYDEMKKIQTRLEFSRSISMIAFIYLILALSMIVPLFIILCFDTEMQSVPGLSMIISRLKPESNKNNHRKIYFKVPVVLLLLFFTYFFSIWAYERESDEFNKRAFGYFSSMVLAEKLKQGENTKPPTPNNSFNPTPR